jgi:hypothetical protein
MKSLLTCFLVFILFPETSICSSLDNNTNQPEGYLPADYELYRTILILDSIFWDAYNTCNIELQTGFYSDSIEFYHDQAGLSNRNNIMTHFYPPPPKGGLRSEPCTRPQVAKVPFRGFRGCENLNTTFNLSHYLITSKEAILKATKENICGKINRELVKGSIEVYPIQGFGAIEIGMHRFVNITADEGTPYIAGKFVFVWQLEMDEWKIRRVISLHI